MAATVQIREERSITVLVHLETSLDYAWEIENGHKFLNPDVTKRPELISKSIRKLQKGYKK